MSLSGKGNNRKCKCTKHVPADAAADNTGPFYNLSKDGKIIKREHARILVENGYIDRADRGYLCGPCLDMVFPEQNYSIRTKKPKLTHVNKVASVSDSSTSDNNCGLSTESSKINAKLVPGPTCNVSGTSTSGGSCDLSEEVCRIKELLEPLVKQDTTKLHKQGRPSLDTLVEYSAKQWLQDRPKALIDLLKSLCGMKTLDDDKKSYLLAKVVEQMYYIKNSKLILPLSFRECIVLYSFTYSKQAVMFSSRTSPSSSYRTINRFLSDEAADPVQMANGSMRVAFDNNQIIGRTYVIKGDNKVQSSVMTSTSYVQLNNSDVQAQNNLKPEHWSWSELSKEQKEEMEVADKPHLQTIFRATRNTHIGHHLKQIERQLDDNHEDYVDKHITKENESAEEKLCIDCGAGNYVSYKSCRTCKGPLQKQDPPDIRDEATRIENFDNHISYTKDIPIRSNSATVQPGEPAFVNPNSFETITTVLWEIGQRAGIRRYGGDEREWMFVECDGLPYKIVRDLCDNVLLCQCCRVSFYGIDKFESTDHRCFRLKPQDCIGSRVREFDWVVAVIGLLHLEMNASRAFIALNWDVFISRLAYVIGFESTKAQLYCKRGSDHHKTWNLLQILYYALTEELLLPYVKYCHQTESEVTVQGYWDWTHSTKDPNYIYILHMVFTYLHALMLFRTGVRHNDVETIQAAMMRLTSLFYGRHHPKYQDILYRDLRDQVTMPPEVKTVLYEAFTFSRTGKPGHYQGGDANLEELNKEAKQHVSCSGVPKDKNWQQVFRNLPKMKTVRQATLSAVGMEDHQTQSEKQMSPKAVGRVRVAVRRSGYLADPHHEKPHKDINNKVEMSKELSQFVEQAAEIRVNYIADKNGGKDPNNKIIPITSSDAENASSITSKTVKQIDEIIIEALDNLPNDIAAIMEDDYRKNFKRKSKAVLVEFYYRIQEELESAEDGEEDNLNEEPE